jgi:Rieske Fe-S protein
VKDAAGRPADVIVLNLGSNNFRAFTSVCTHEGCIVGTFTGTRIVCPCHGSEYNTSGSVVNGPATRALTEYTTMFDAASQTVTVRKS